MFELDGRVAVITGAGGMRGIGRAVALRLAQQGAQVAITDFRRALVDRPPAEVAAGWEGLHSVADEVRAAGAQCLAVECDLGDRAEIGQLIERASDHYGRVDILVNNARAIIGRDKAPITELDEAVWDHFLAINTTAVFLLTKGFGRKLVAQKDGGRIINVASIAARQGRLHRAAYCASKFAVMGLTQTAALDLAPYGITVNAVCPGTIDSGRLSYWERAQADETGVSLEEFRAKIIAAANESIPVGRIGEPEDVAAIVAFLASAEASFITGQGIDVNGGVLFG